MEHSNHGVGGSFKKCNKEGGGEEMRAKGQRKDSGKKVLNASRNQS